MTENERAIPTDRPPLSLVMGMTDRMAVAEVLLCSRRALPFREIVRRSGESEDDVRETLQAFLLFKMIEEPSHGLYRWRRGSNTGRHLSRLRELLHAKQHPDSWAASLQEGEAHG